MINTINSDSQINKIYVDLDVLLGSVNTTQKFNHGQKYNWTHYLIIGFLLCDDKIVPEVES